MNQNILSNTPDLYLKEPLATRMLAEALKKGYLTLFIGAGISKSASDGFPRWHELVKYCCKISDVEFDIKKARLGSDEECNTEYLLSKMEEVKSKIRDEDYIDIVKNSLYGDITYNYSLMGKDLLVALGSIIMGSIRGNADCVVNFNFDDLFEWYLDQYGFKTQVISNYPCIIGKSDVNIFHPHGFLPKLDNYKPFKTDRIVLSKDEYQKVIYEEVSPWNEFLRHLLSTKLTLFIGMSGDDPHINSLCNYVYTKETLICKKRILGFIILVDNIENRSKKDENLRRGLVNMYIKDYSELPEKLLSICKEATNL